MHGNKIDINIDLILVFRVVVVVFLCIIAFFVAINLIKYIDVFNYFILVNSELTIFVNLLTNELLSFCCIC